HHRDHRRDARREEAVFDSRQRRGFRSAPRRTPLRHLPAPACREGFRGNGRRPVDCAAHRRAPWRQYLGGGRAGSGSGVPLHPSVTFPGREARGDAIISRLMPHRPLSSRFGILSLILLAAAALPAHAQWRALHALEQRGALVSAAALDLDDHNSVIEQLNATSRLTPASLTKLTTAA